MINYNTYTNFYDNQSSTQEFHFVPLHTRQFITEYILNKQKKEKFTVIDIGSAADFWTRPFADVTVDYYIDLQSKKHFKVNIERESSWKQITDYVEENGLFDFCTCSHTLEDLYYPFLAFEMFPKIAKQGWIAVPSFHREMAKGDRGQLSKGYDHHGFIYHPTDKNEVLAIPKMGHMEYKKYNIDTSGMKNELQIFWNKHIDVIDITTKYEVFQESPKVSIVNTRDHNISSKLFEIYCSFDPNERFSYGS
jgi:hypothetical protein